DYGRGLLHVGLNPILPHGPQQATLWLPPDTFGDLWRWSRQERDPTNIDTVRLLFHTGLLGAFIKRPCNFVSHDRGRRRALLTGRGLSRPRLHPQSPRVSAFSEPRTVPVAARSGAAE